MYIYIYIHIDVYICNEYSQENPTNRKNSKVRQHVESYSSFFFLLIVYIAETAQLVYNTRAQKFRERENVNAKFAHVKLSRRAYDQPYPTNLSHHLILLSIYCPDNSNRNRDRISKSSSNDDSIKKRIKHNDNNVNFHSPISACEKLANVYRHYIYECQDVKKITHNSQLYLECTKHPELEIIEICAVAFPPVGRYKHFAI